MSTMPVLQISYPRQREEVRDQRRIHAWLEAIAAQGYYVTTQEDPFSAQWAEALRTHSPAPGVSAEAHAHARAFCAGERETLGCQAYSLAEDFWVGVDSSFADGLLSLDTTDGYFTFGEALQHKYTLFLAFAEVTYRVWHPLYGFEYDDAGKNPYTTYEEAQQLVPRFLYNLNLFGPEYVTRLGRERLLSAPAWQVKELDDGSILIVPAPYVLEDWRHPSPYSRLAIAQHLGIPFE